MKTIQAELFHTLNAQLAEGPVWDHRLNCWYCVDITAGRIFRLDTSGNRLSSWDIGRKVGAALLCDNVDHLLLACADGFYDLNLQTGTCRQLHDPEPQLINNRFNDAAIDRNGRCWAGTMHDDCAEPSGSLYRYEANGQCTQMLTEISCSNGLAWNNADNRLFYIDTLTNKIDQFDYNATTGTISERNTLVDIPEAQGLPDGMCIDTNETLWVALWDGHGVQAYDSATGEIIARIDVPTGKVTSCCFGGPELDTLLITTANPDNENNTTAGQLYTCQTGTTGITSPLFSLK